MTTEWLYEAARPMMDVARRRKITPCFEFLQRSQSWSARRLNEWKTSLLKKLVFHAYGTVPYYRRVMRSAGLTPSDIRTIRDFERMPILTRQDVKANPQDILSREYPRARMISDHTSGSTGEPLNFYRTLFQQSWGRAAQLRGELWHGFLGKRAWMLPVSPSLHSRHVVRFSLQRCILFNSVNISEETLGWFVRRLRDTGTRMLRGEPSSLHILARFVENREPDIELDVIISDGDTLDAEMREDIERVFRCRIFDFYGCTEVGVIAVQCPGCDRYVVSDEMVHLELVEHEGGDQGDVVVSSLVNYGMPFIRYAIGDVASGMRDGCECGRAHTTLSAVRGKVWGLVARRGGSFIRTLFYESFMGMPVKMYRVIQRDYERFSVFVVPDEGFAEGHTNSIKERMREILGPVEIELSRVEAIPALPGGKHSYIISEVPYTPTWLKAKSMA